MMTNSMLKLPRMLKPLKLGFTMASEDVCDKIPRNFTFADLVEAITHIFSAHPGLESIKILYERSTFQFWNAEIYKVAVKL